MIYRRLGKTELQVSVIGFGGIPIQRIDESSVEKVVNHAIELGITSLIPPEITLIVKKNLV